MSRCRQAPAASPSLAHRVSGSIEPGKSADLVVLDRTLFAQPIEEIALANIDLTIVAGQVVYERPA